MICAMFQHVTIRIMGLHHLRVLGLKTAARDAGMNCRVFDLFGFFFPPFLNHLMNFGLG